MRHQTTAAAIVSAAMLVLTSCGNGDNDESSTTTTVAETTTTTQATTTSTTETTTTTSPFLTIEEAGARYLELAAPANCAIEQHNALWEEGRWAAGFSEDEFPAFWPEAQPLYQRAADTTLAWIEAVVAEPWPPEVQADIDTLVAQASEQATYYQRYANVETVDDFLFLDGSLGATPPTATAATTVRAKLGIDSNIGSGAREDHCASPV